MIANCTAQHWIPGLERVEDRSLRSQAFDIKLHFAVNPRECAQMGWQQNTYHCSVCTSTDRTAGRSRTIGFQLSPALVDA